MKIRTVAIASYTAFVVLTGGGAQAQPMGQWGGGFGQGIWEAGVENPSGGRFSVHCSSDRSGLIFYVVDMVSSTAAPRNVEATLRIDGDNWHWPLRREVQSSGQVMYSWDAGDDAHEMRALVRALRRGHRVEVLVPGDGVNQTFPLRGSGRALADCA